MRKSLVCFLVAITTGISLFNTGSAVTLAQQKKAPAARPKAEPPSASENHREPGRTFPSLPGAIRELPAWIDRNPPFGVAQIFKTIPAHENAAPLYFEVLYEFVPNEMRGCVAPEIVDARDEYLVDRATRTWKLLTASEEDVTPAERAAIVAEYAETFDKLARAQQRPRCAFETGISLTTVLPHAQSARQVVRLLNWRVEARISRKDIDGALDDISMGLRLSRDLRPRGFFISQLVSFALNSVIASTLVPRVLDSSNLKVEHCDRLLDLVTRHATEELDPLAEGFRIEYLMCRDIVRNAELKLDPAVVAALDEPVRAAADSMTAADFAAEVELLDRYFEPMIGRGSRPLRGAFRPQQGQQEALAGMKICRQVLSGIPQVFEACRRDRTRLSATRCLIALRRWQLKSNGANPPDLHVLCKETGMDAVPVDEYSDAGEPLRSTLVAGKFVIYSIAGDGKDDQARVDWEFGKQPGDWIFRLPQPQ